MEIKKTNQIGRAKMEKDHRATREIKTEIAELNRRGDIGDFSSPAADVETAKFGHLLAESLSLSDADVDRAWHRADADELAGSDEMQGEVIRALKTVAKSGVSSPSTDGSAD